MVKTKADFTMTFRALSELSLSELNDRDVIKNHWALHDYRRIRIGKNGLTTITKDCLIMVTITTTRKDKRG